MKFVKLSDYIVATNTLQLKPVKAPAAGAACANSSPDGRIGNLKNLISF